MSNDPIQSKWHAIKQRSEAENPNTAVDNAAKIKRLYLDTQIGSPVDTAEEIDAQRHNTGPKDTRIELEGLDSDEPSHTPKP